MKFELLFWLVMMTVADWCWNQTRRVALWTAKHSARAEFRWEARQEQKWPNGESSDRPSNKEKA